MANTKSIRRNRAAAKLAARRTLRRYTLGNDDFTLSFVSQPEPPKPTLRCAGLGRDAAGNITGKVYVPA